MAFEEVTGKDLNWFWNQWYYGAGHPKLDIDYSYDDAAKKVQVIVKQTQAGDKIFKLPVAIDIYNGANKTRYNVWAKNKSDTFHLLAASKPDLVNFDGDKILLCRRKKTKHSMNIFININMQAIMLTEEKPLTLHPNTRMMRRPLTFLKTALKDKYEGLTKFYP